MKLQPQPDIPDLEEPEPFPDEDDEQPEVIIEDESEEEDEETDEDDLDESTKPEDQDDDISLTGGEESVLIDIPHKLKLILNSKRYHIFDLSNLALQMKSILLNEKENNEKPSYV